MMAVASSAHTAPHHAGMGSARSLAEDGSTDWGVEVREDADDGVSDAKGGGGREGRGGGRDIATFFCFEEGGRGNLDFSV